MDTKCKTTLSFLLGLGLILGLLPLSACGSMLAASAEPTPTLTAVPVEVVTEPPVRLDLYVNETYQLAFEIPSGWTLSEYPVGEGVSGYAPSQAIELNGGGYRLLVHLKYAWDPTVVGGGLGAGEVVGDGTALLLGRLVPRNRLVDAGLTKLVWYGGMFADLELYIRLEDVSTGDWAAIDIPDAVVGEVEAILATFVRTGAPLDPPADPTPIPTLQPSVTCDLPPRLAVNGWARVTPGLPNAVRSAPGRGTDSTVVGEIPAGATVRVLEGSVCADGSHWWRIDAGLLSGWTPEGGSGIYWLEPVAAESSIPVDGWVGALVSAAEWPQVDDYFQLLDQGGWRYGIHALDPGLRQQLAAYRDTGTQVRIWGTLYYGRMDAYNTQIEVTRIEVYQPGSQSPTGSVDDWVGVIVANPPGAQFDDYFQAMDQNGTRYGIDSLDESIRQQIVALRSSGRVVHVWGTLTLDVPDAYGVQILVTRLEVAP